MPVQISDEKWIELFSNVDSIKETADRLEKDIEDVQRELDDVKTFKTSVVLKLAGWFVAAITAIMGVIMAGLAAIGRWVLPTVVKALADGTDIVALGVSTIT